MTRLHARLLARLETFSPALIALSGGVDSRLLCLLASQAAGDFAAVHVRGPHVPRAETGRARHCCAELGLELHEILCDPLEMEAVRDNTRERCYHCKRDLFGRAWSLAVEHEFEHVLDGTIASDKEQYRPGQRALEELFVTSPLADAGLSKDQVRVLARGLGLPDWNAPARPCLLTRFAYDQVVDSKLLPLLDSAEALLLRGGLREFRLRVPERGRFELQLAAADQDLWELQGPGALDALEKLGIRDVRVRILEAVSGCYDRDTNEKEEHAEKKLDKL